MYWGQYGSINGQLFVKGNFFNVDADRLAEGNAISTRLYANAQHFAEKEEMLNPDFSPHLD
ncbi:hypothetical protein CDG77_01700 [Nostoc sp. 'Peltigera membranacea cyanobiont' 213]|nr:hypothetical protein CDG77_01700 [Nostoc sp. 'Peltigera membranacea cyanobiont' 213]